MSSPLVHTDCINTKANRQIPYVFVCATVDEQKVLYFAYEKKRYESVKKNVKEDFYGIRVHDHEITFYSYGIVHHEYLAFVQWYLKYNIENESSLIWN